MGPQLIGRHVHDVARTPLPALQLQALVDDPPDLIEPAEGRKAANLEAYEKQLEEMRESFGAMLRQLPNKTEVAELKDGSVRRFSIQPEDFGLTRSPLDAIKASDPADSVKTILGVLDNQAGAARDIVVLNAGADRDPAEVEAEIIARVRAEIGPVAAIMTPPASICSVPPSEEARPAMSP